MSIKWLQMFQVWGRVEKVKGLSPRPWWQITSRPLTAILIPFIHFKLSIWPSRIKSVSPCMVRHNQTLTSKPCGVGGSVMKQLLATLFKDSKGVPFAPPLSSLPPNSCLERGAKHVRPWKSKSRPERAKYQEKIWVLTSECHNRLWLERVY